MQRWRIVKANLIPSETQAQVKQSSKRAAARERWRFLQRTFLPETAKKSSRAANTEPSSPRTTLNNTVITATTNTCQRPLASARSASQRLQGVRSRS